MDGSQHPKQTDASIAAGDASDPNPAAMSKDVASQSPETDHIAAKRQHSTEIEEPEAKRQHVMEAEPDELDLDALMAQLQRHTEQASMPDKEKNVSDNNAQGAQNPEHDMPSQPHQEAHMPVEQPMSQSHETELSIEQQLKGALSSLQELEGDGDGDDEDDDSDGEGAAIALDQLSAILNPPKPTEQSDQAPEKDQKAPTDSQAQKDSLSDDLELTSSSSNDKVSATKATSGEPSKETPREGTGESPSELQTDAVKHSQASTENPNSREALLARMPPPPSASGTLPPMPPPPAALTSPTAPLTALELSQGAFHGSDGSRASSDPRALSSHLHRLYSPTFSEPPALPTSYESALADQVDALTTKEGEPQQEEFHRALHLNDNQAVLQARQRSIPLLDSLAGQILDVLSCSHYQETLATVMQPESERGLAYRLLLDAFEDVKRIYGKWKTNSSRVKAEPKPDEARPFLPYNIPGVEATRQNITSLQRANLATFVAAVFGTIEIGFWELDKWFLKVFVPETGRLLKQQANIYLDLKTQAYISAVEGSDDSEVRSQALEHLFPDDLEMQMKDSLSDRVTLAPSEQDFVAKCQRRKENIKAENDQDLSAKYHWVPFLREVSDYVSRNHYTLLPQRKLSTPAAEPTVMPGPSVQSSRLYAPQRKQPSSSQSRGRETSPAVSTTAGPEPEEANAHEAGSASDVHISSVKTNSEHRDPKKEIEDNAEQVSSNSAVPEQGEKGAQTSEQNPPEGSSEHRRSVPHTHPDIPAEGHPLFPPLPKQVIPPPSLLASSSSTNDNPSPQGYERYRRPGPRPHSQPPVAANNFADTLALYEAAKASAEGTDAIRPKTSMFTTRRTWTQEEEQALLKGMDRVQGPYWAQILELYGPGGKISEVLKDRSQVQLKDKARNLKMLFIRLGYEIPAVFQYVTGDYETRRTSGKKVKERKQRQGPPDYPYQAGPSLHQRRPSQPQSSQPQQVGSAGTPPVSHTPQAGTASAKQVAIDAPTTNAAASQQPEVEITQPPSSASRPEPVSGTIPTSGADQSPQSNSQLSSTPSPSAQSSSHAPRQEANKNSSLPVDLEPKASDDRVTNTEKPMHADPMPIEGGLKATNELNGAEQKKSEAEHPAGSGATGNSEEDKEEDISALLNRMGEYVNNH